MELESEVGGLDNLYSDNKFRGLNTIKRCRQVSTTSVDNNETITKEQTKIAPVSCVRYVKLRILNDSEKNTRSYIRTELYTGHP